MEIYFNFCLINLRNSSIITLARDLGYDVQESLIPREALYIADEIFFTGSAAEVTPIRSVDRISIGSGSRGPVTERIQKAYFDYIGGRVGDKYDWRTPVPVAARSK